MATVPIVGFGGAMAALWASTGSVLNAVAVVGHALGEGAQALDNLATVANETSGVYMEESRATRKAKKLALDREFALLEAGGVAPVATPAPAFALN